MRGLRNYIVYFNCNTMFECKYAVIQSTSLDNALFFAVDQFGRGCVARVAAASEREYARVKCYGYELVQIQAVM